MNADSTKNPLPAQGSEPGGWVDLHGQALFAFAMLRVRDRGTAEELVQETLLAALQSRARFSGQGSERTWLIGILKHKALDHFRRRFKERRVDEGGLDDDPYVAGLFDDTTVGHWRRPPAPWRVPSSGVFGSDLEKQEFMSVLEQCLRGLPARSAQAFVLRMVDEKDAVTVCKMIGVSPTNLSVLLHRARLRLRGCMEERWFLDKGST